MRIVALVGGLHLQYAFFGLNGDLVLDDDPWWSILEIARAKSTQIGKITTSIKKKERGIEEITDLFEEGFTHSMKWKIPYKQNGLKNGFLAWEAIESLKFCLERQLKFWNFGLREKWNFENFELKDWFDEYSKSLWVF